MDMETNTEKPRGPSRWIIAICANSLTYNMSFDFLGFSNDFFGFSGIGKNSDKL